MDTQREIANLLDRLRTHMPEQGKEGAMVILKDSRHNLVVGAATARDFLLMSVDGKNHSEAYEEAVEMASDFIEACRPKRKKKSPDATDTSKNG